MNFGLVWLFVSLNDYRKTKPGPMVQITEMKEKYYHNKKTGYDEKYIPNRSKIFISKDGKEFEENDASFLTRIRKIYK